MHWSWWYLAWLPLWFAAIYTALSFLILAPNERAAMYWLNKRWKIVGPGGWHWRPLFFASAKRFSTHTNRVEIPGRREQIVRDDDAPLGPNQVRAFRVLHASKENAEYYVLRPKDETDPGKGQHYLRVPFRKLKDDEKDLLTGDDTLHSAVTTEVIAVIYWDLKANLKPGEKEDETLFDFVENVGSVSETDRRIDNTSRGALQDILGHVTARHAIDAKDHVQEELKTRLEILVGEIPDPEDPDRSAERPWGVNISGVQIEEVNPGKTVNKARADEAASISVRRMTVENAKASAEATRTEAEANAFSTERTADANAYAEVKLGEAKAEAFRKQAEALSTPAGLEAARLETAKEVMAKAGTIIVPGDMGGLIVAATKVVEAVKK